MTGKHISAYSGIHRIKQKPQTPGHISAYTGVQRIKREEEATDKGGLLGSVEYVGGRFALGAGQMAEGITDTALAAVHLARLNPEAAAQVYKDNVTGDLSERLQEAHNPSTVTQLAGDVASGIGTSLMYMIPKAGIFLGAAGTFGSNVSEAAEKTGEVGLKELGYAATATVPEVALEGLIGAGVRGGKALFSAGSKALTKGTAKAGVKTVGKTATKVSKSLLGHVALETAKGMAGEGAEEAITEAIDPFLLRLFKIDENAQLDMGNVVYAGLIGALSGGLMTSGPAAINYKSSQAAGRMIREAGLTDAFIEETRELLGGADRAKTKAEAAKGEKVNAEEGSGVIGKVTAMGKNTVNTVRQSKIASSAKRIAETTRKNLQSFEQFNAKENKTAQEQAIADAMLGELRGNVYLLETSYLSETYEQAILDATPEQKQDIVDFINKSMAEKKAAKSDYTVADLDADTDGILTSMAAKYVEGDLERYMGIHRVDSMEGRGKKATETAEEAATSPWSGLADGEDVSAFGATGEAEEALLAAAVRESVPKGSIPEMLAQFRKGTAMSPEEFASAWSDGAHIFGRYGLEVDKESPLSRMEPEAREAAMKFGRETEEAERKASEEKAKAKKKPAAQAGKKGTVVRGEGLNVQKLSDEQYAAYKAAEVLAEVLGTEIVIENGITDKAGRTVNGYYDTKTNRIHININAMRNGKNISLYTLGHEVTHYIKEWSPTKFEALADFVLDQISVDAETAVAEKLASLKRLGIVTDTMTVAEANAKAREELVAEGMELVLTDGKVLEELSKTDKSLWEKIRDWFFDIIGQIRRSWQDMNQASKTAQVLKETVESLEEIERLFTEGVREAGERTRTAGVETVTRMNEEKMHVSGKKLSIEQEPNTGTSYVRIDVTDIQGEGIQPTDSLGRKARLYMRQRFNGIVLPLGRSKRAYVRKEGINEYTNPAKEIENETYRSKMLAATELDNLLKNASYLGWNPDDGRHPDVLRWLNYETIFMVGDENNQPRVFKGIVRIKRIARGDCFYDITKIEDITSGNIGQAIIKSAAESTSDVLNDSITQPENSVNRQFSISEENSSDTAYLAAVERGDTETAQKMVDEAARAAGVVLNNENNQPLHLYHGGNAGITVFDGKKGINGRLANRSATYFTPYREVANNYRGRGANREIYDCYLLLHNPLVIVSNDYTKVANLNDEKVLELKSQGYDGVIFYPDERSIASGWMSKDNNEYVAFDSWQIKSANPVTYDDNGNVIPLSERFKEDNTDIRYSIDDNSLVEKYPNLNLNQDVSDMDGVPAIQLEDGSVLTFTEPHVTFIQNNGIDVEDIRSGGWIADGVYEPSERSDTLRYKERMLAKKRMDEKRAAKKGDIRYSIDETTETPDVSENRDLTDREILGIALEGAVQSQEEYNIVKSYREQASMLELVKEKRNGYSKEAAALERQIKALRARMEEEGDPNGFIRKALDEAIAKKRNAEAMRDEQDRILDNSTKELLKLKAAKPFRELIDREGRRAKAAERKAAKAVESADAKVERTKQRADRRIEQAKAEYESREKYKDDRREVTTRKRAAQRILGSLNTALYNPTKAKHVPLQLHDLVETTLKSADPKQFGINRDHIREMSELAAKIERLEKKVALTGEEQETLNKMKGRYEHLEADTISVKRQAEALNTAFKQYQKQVTEADMMDKDLMDALDGYVAEIEEATLAEMNLKSLIAVERFYTALLHQVNNSNKTFATEKAVAIDKLGTDANTEVKEVKALKFLQPRAMELAGLAGVRGFFWNNMKPLTVFDAIGSETFAKLFKNVMDGEDVWATDLEEAHEFLQKTKKEYGYDKWDLKKRSEITTADGTKVALTLGEKMSLYAYMFREQAEEHLSIGGFTFAPDAKTVAAYKNGSIKYEAVLNDQKQYHMRKEDIVKMAESLTEEQRAYAEAVQKYLTSLGRKGNEVSVKLYGLELFNETAYFPIKSNRDYLAASTGKSGDPNIKSRGTFKETVPDASNPIVLEDFMEVTTNHINTMATYHAFVLPIEDLTRVWNYTPVNIKRDENGEAILDENGMPVADTDGAAGYNSLKAEITKKYGTEANDYILQLIRDLNGGARRDAAATILDKGLTAFKRAAITMSASTIIQQPTSVIRAMAYVDAKHFSGASITPWETVKKYAKVAFIKEMGGHDINTGARTQEFLNRREYDNIGQKVKAAVTPEVYGGDPQARAEFFGWLTSKADEKTWCFLFGAVVNEQAERLGKPKDSEEVLKAAGERFTEVVRRTQVYDSTLTRSQYMRSKDGLMKMATSFMAEPTTVVSMAADAIIRLERGDKMFIRKTAAGIAGSIILNAMAVSLIYAMRDDDEEKNYLEKYISSLTGEIVEGLNPLEYFPILRDIMSLFKGYEIERSDMTLINNLLEQVELITSSKRSFMDKMIGVTGAVAAFFGIPVTNVYRDVKGLTTTTVSLFTGEPVTAKGTASAALEGVTDQFGLFKKLLGGDRGTSYELYRAKVSGDNSHYTRVAARYDSPEAEEQALRRELRENDKRIGEAAEARRSGDIEVYKSLVEQITDEGIFDRGMVIRAIQTEMNALSRETEKGTVVPKDTEVADEETVEVVSLYSSSDLNAALERGDTEDFKEIYESMVSDRVQAGKTEAQAKSAVKSSITAYWKPRYIEARNANDTETMKKILQILLSSGLYGSRNDVATLLEGWIKAYAKSK